jgi:hypothetical protein
MTTNPDGSPALTDGHTFPFVTTPPILFDYAFFLDPVGSAMQGFLTFIGYKITFKP